MICIVVAPDLRPSRGARRAALKIRKRTREGNRTGRFVRSNRFSGLVRDNTEEGVFSVSRTVRAYRRNCA